MLDPHSSCPTLGHATGTRLLATIRDRWTERASLEGQAAAVLADLDVALVAASDRWPLRVIEDETGVPRSTASGRVLRYRARITEAGEAA